jgi:hypothetical protein
MPGKPGALGSAPENSQRSEPVTNGNLLYLMLCLGTFGVFAAVLAYESWQQGRLGHEVILKPAEHDHGDQAVAA